MCSALGFLSGCGNPRLAGLSGLVGLFARRRSSSRVKSSSPQEANLIYLFIIRLQCVQHSQGAAVNWWFLQKKMTVPNQENKLDEKASSFQNKKRAAALIKSADQSRFSFPGVKFLFSCLFCTALVRVDCVYRAQMSGSCEEPH